MKGVRFTKQEVAAIEEANTILRAAPADMPKGWSSVMRKIQAADAPSSNAAVGPIETALVAASRGKIVEMDKSGYGRASVQAGRMGVTPEDAALVGRWCASQGWLRGPLTMLTVLNKWPDWVSKARATVTPSSAPPGFGDVAGVKGEEATPGAARPGAANRDGRPAPGFRPAR